MVSVAHSAESMRAAALAGKHGCPFYTQYKDILDKAAAAVIAVPTDRHHEVGMACLKRGIHYVPVVTDSAWDELVLYQLRQKHLIK